MQPNYHWRIHKKRKTHRNGLKSLNWTRCFISLKKRVDPDQGKCIRYALGNARASPDRGFYNYGISFSRANAKYNRLFARRTDILFRRLLYVQRFMLLGYTQLRLVRVRRIQSKESTPTYDIIFPERHGAVVAFTVVWILLWQ